MIIDGHVHLTEPVDFLLKNMDKNDIDKSVICSSGVARGEKINSFKKACEEMQRISKAYDDAFSLDLNSVKNENKKIGRLANKYSERLIGFGKVDLRFTKRDIKAQIDQIFDLGLAGIGEIIGIKGRFGKFETVIRNSILENKIPLFIHTDYPIEEKEIKNIFEFAAKYREAKIILGHMGGNNWIQAIKGAKKYKNIYLDMSEAVNFIAVKAAILKVPEKVIFGSDYPWDLPSVGLERLKNIKIDKENKKRILSTNLKSILPQERK